MASLTVLDPGFFTTVQDNGRFGSRKFGVPVGGSMDSFARRSANWLVGNDSEAPVLEMTIRGGTYKFHDEAFIGLAGGEVDITMNGRKQKQYETLAVSSGEEVQIGRVKTGCRVYMAIAGNWELDKIMGSFSTCVQAGFGGLEGRKVSKGDCISWAYSHNITKKTIPENLLPYFGHSYQIRIIEGPEWDWLNKDEQEAFLNLDFKVQPESNRMGIRLKSSASLALKKENMVSSPVLPGMIQLPPGGDPIILMNDAQSVGGYPRVAKVVDADLWRLGQVWPPAKIRFKLITRKEALKLSAFQENILYSGKDDIKKNEEF